MGRQDPARLAAIRAELAAEEPTRDEEFHDFLETCETEESRDTVNDNEFRDRCDAVFADIKRRGITPNAWYAALEWPDAEDCIVRDEVAERWETEVLLGTIIDEVDQNDGCGDEDKYFTIHENELEDMAPEPPDAYEDAESALWDDWESFDALDEWSGPHMPMSAVTDL